MVTGSHNPPDYNGLKMVLGGVTLALDDIQRLRARIDSGDLTEGAGKYSTADVREAYLARIVSDARLARPMHIVIDCGNGVAGATAPELFRRLGCKVTPLYCEVDGKFPNHHPDPSKPENLRELIAAVRDSDAELGLAFDGDGDRLGVVTKRGHIIYPDRQLMLFADDVLKRNPGAEIIYDVKCTRRLASWITERGGKPLMWKTGHSLIKAKMKERGSPLAGEMSGHIFFGERWYGFDDAQYVGARLLEILSRVRRRGRGARRAARLGQHARAQLEAGRGRAAPADRRTAAKRALSRLAREIIKLDGLRVEYADGFGLARASNTTPVIVLRFEGDTQAAIERIQAEFRAVLQAAKPGAALPF